MTRDGVAAAQAAWTDSHNHLAMEEFDADRDEVIERASAAGVASMVIVGTSPGDWRACADLARRHGFRATAGLHPHEASSWSEDTRSFLRETLGLEEISAVGEIGLDYFYDNSPRAQQRKAFEDQCRLAVEEGLPVVVHSRDAFEYTVAILSSFEPSLKGVIHCFSYGPREVEKFLDLGFFISFSGIVSFPKAEAVREAAALVPLHRLLVETDAPYLAPVPFRGKRCEPCHVADVGRSLARWLSLEEGCLASATTKNALALLGPPLAPADHR